MELAQVPILRDALQRAQLLARRQTLPTPEDRAWVRAALDAIPVTPDRTDLLRTFAASVRQQLHKRDREIETLRTEPRELRAELAVARQLDDEPARPARSFAARGLAIAPAGLPGA